MTDHRIAVVDLETTGLSPWKHDRVVEIAVVMISPDGVVTTEYDTLVNPNRDIGPSSIHQVAAADVLQAPSFEDIAGDVIELLAGATVIAGHNVSFDKNFLVKEYDRLGAELPKLPLLCTCALFGRNSLEACCAEFGITFEGMPHRALSDARATARLVTYASQDDPSLLNDHHINGVQWPTLQPKKTPRYCREHAEQARLAPPRFLQRIVSGIRHDVEANAPNLLAYMTLIDRVLEDRTIDASEEEVLVTAAADWNLSMSQLERAHAQYLHSLAVLALADGVVTESERRDLHDVARLLGQDDSSLDAMLAAAEAQLRIANRPPKPSRPESSGKEGGLRGQRVCFTGELQSSINGELISRQLAETLARKAGLEICGNVSKKLDLLVVADPNTQSGKAKKAREYGIRILSDVVFWRMIGVSVD